MAPILGGIIKTDTSRARRLSFVVMHQTVVCEKQTWLASSFVVVCVLYACVCVCVSNPSNNAYSQLSSWWGILFQGKTFRSSVGKHIRCSYVHDAICRPGKTKSRSSQRSSFIWEHLVASSVYYFERPFDLLETNTSDIWWGRVKQVVAAVHFCRQTDKWSYFCQCRKAGEEDLAKQLWICVVPRRLQDHSTG